MTNYVWKSDLASHMQQFLMLKRMAGFKYERQTRRMERFDQYCYDIGFIGDQLNMELVNDYCYSFPYERACTRYEKEKLLSELAEHLCTIGHPSYICDKKFARKKIPYMPYIFSEEELGKLFRAIDTHPSDRASSRHIVDGVLFRMIYGCGLRLSEALNLKLKHVDLNEGTLTILQSKNNKDRKIPMAKSLVDRCKKYSKEMHSFSGQDAYYFMTSFKNRIDNNTAYERFRNYLWYARIPHGGRGSGPRIHDLRHVFCIHCLKRWVLAGKDLTNLFPYLSVYMGHADFRGTQYYLRLTADLYPDIIKKMEVALGYVIPEGGVHEKS